jgi:hypothetical protein
MKVFELNGFMNLANHEIDFVAGIHMVAHFLVLFPVCP